MGVLHYPPTLQWEMTAECNHDCIHCYNYWRKDFEKIADLSRSKSVEEYYAIARKIVDLKPVAVTITGGEPLLVNGIHLFISFPCADPEVCDVITNRKGSFQKIVKSLDLIHSYGIDFAPNMVVSRMNIDYVEMTVEYLRQRYDVPYVPLVRQILGSTLMEISRLALETVAFMGISLRIILTTSMIVCMNGETGVLFLLNVKAARNY